MHQAIMKSLFKHA